MNTETQNIVREDIRDILAQRYASTPLVNLWGPRNRIVLERRFWLAVLQGQSTLGFPVPAGALSAYERHVDTVDFASIKQRELRTKQDVVARAEEFNALAGFDCIGVGLTSRDTTDNVEQYVIKLSLEHVRDRSVAMLARFGRKATEFTLLDLSGRSHNVPGQTTTLGKRYSNFADDLLVAYERLKHLIAVYPLRGIKGAMGTQQDMADLLGSSEKVTQLEDQIRKHFGFEFVLDSVGQVYPRSLDFDVVSTLAQLGSAAVNLATMVRLMAGHDLLHEGFKAGQSGSFAQPHKMNSRTSERARGLLDVLCGFQDMLSRLLGNQWNEGDVSCSVVRRVALPGAFFALDGIYESMMHVLDEMEVFPEMIHAELKRYLPFLSATRLLMAACKKGKGRDAMHSVIKKHAVAALKTMRQGGENRFEEMLSVDSEFPLSREEITGLTGRPNCGASQAHVDEVLWKITGITQENPEAARYMPEPML